MTAGRRWAARAGCVALGALVLGAPWSAAGTAAAAPPRPSAAAIGPESVWTASCPGPTCPYSAPTTTEQGFAQDLLARMNIEREQPARDYLLGGQRQALGTLRENELLEETAQAAAEYLAVTGELEDYGGVLPSGELAVGSNAGGPGLDSAGAHKAFMESPAHAAGMLSAAPDFVGIGVACDTTGHAWEVELFADADQATWEAGQAREAAELASNSVYAQSDGTITSVPEPPIDGGGSDNASQVFPTDPIAAGSQFATGVDWTCQGPEYPQGSSPGSPLPAPVVGMAATPDGGGYVMDDAAGAVAVHGDADFFGSAADLDLAAPVEQIVATPDGGGYWLVAADGGIFAFGDAAFYGSTGGKHLNAPVVGMAATPDGGGYWLVVADGGIFAFGDAAFYGSTGGKHLNAPVVGMAGSNDGGGYWLVASDGGVFTFGDAAFYGSTGSLPLDRPVVGMAADDATGGYWLVASDGGVFAFGAPFDGAD